MNINLKKWIKFIFTAYLLFVTVIFTGCGKSLEQQIAEQLELGQKYLAEQNYEEAIVAFNKVIETEPKEIEAYIGLLDAYMHKGDMEKAEMIANKGIAFFTEEEMEIEQDKVTKFMKAAESYYAEKNDPEDNIIENHTLALQNSEEYKNDAGEIYDAYGRIVRRYNYEKEMYTDYTYDDSGLVITFSSYTLAGEFLYSGEYFYDNFGRKKRLEGVETYQDGTIGKYTYIYSYNNDNDLYPERQDNYSENGELMCYFEYKYDENGNRISKTKYDPEGNVITE